MKRLSFNKIIDACLRIREEMDCVELNDIVTKAFGELKLPEGKPTTFMVYTGVQHVQMPMLNKAEVNDGQNKGKLEAVKTYKNRVGCSLMDAKHAVEEWFVIKGLSFYKGQ